MSNSNIVKNKEYYLSIFKEFWRKTETANRTLARIDDLKDGIQLDDRIFKLLNDNNNFDLVAKLNDQESSIILMTISGEDNNKLAEEIKNKLDENKNKLDEIQSTSNEMINLNIKNNNINTIEQHNNLEKSITIDDKSINYIFDIKYVTKKNNTFIISGITIQKKGETIGSGRRSSKPPCVILKFTGFVLDIPSDEINIRFEISAYT